MSVHCLSARLFILFFSSHVSASVGLSTRHLASGFSLFPRPGRFPVISTPPSLPFAPYILCGGPPFLLHVCGSAPPRALLPYCLRYDIFLQLPPPSSALASPTAFFTPVLACPAFFSVCVGSCLCPWAPPASLLLPLRLIRNSNGKTLG